jgi:hypothetical protein
MGKLTLIFRTILHDLVALLAPKWLKKRMMSCEDIAFIISNETNIPLTKRIGLKMHLLICQCCTNYSQQLRIISEESKRVSAPKFTSAQEEQISKSKDDMLKKLLNK